MALSEQVNTTGRSNLSALREQAKDHAVFLLDLSGKIISCNKNIEQVTGYTEAEMCSMSISVFFSETEKNKESHAIECANETGSYSDELPFIKRDGSTIRALISLSALPDESGSIRNYHLSLVDLSKNMYVSNLTSHIAALFEKTNDAIFSTDASFKIVSWNKAAETLYGYRKEEVLNKTTDEIFQPDIPVEERLKIRHHIGSKGYWQGEADHKRKDGKLIHILVSVNAIKDDAGNIEKFLVICTNISELKSNKAELLELQKDIARITKDKLDKSLKEIADYKYALDASSMVAIADQNGIIKYVNDNFCEISKFSCNELIGKNFDILNPDDSSKVFTHEIWQTVKSGKIWRGEVKNKAKDNSYYWLHLTVVPFMNDDRMPWQYLGIGTNITEKREAEMAYRHSEETRSLIIKSALDAIVGMDVQGHIVLWNSQAEKIFGWRHDEVMGKQLAEIIIPYRYREAHERGLATYLKTGEGPVLNKTLQIMALHRNNREFPIELSIVPISQNKKNFFCAFIRDITERKKWEREIMESEQKYKMLFENNPLPMWMFTIPQRNVIEVNNAAISHYGYTREEFLKMNVLHLRPEEDRERFLEETKTYLGGVRNAGVWRHIKKDGTLIYVEIFRDDIIYKGQQVRLVLANDISEKFMTEQRLKESHEELRNLASHLQDIREEERADIAREIHDELGQQITGLKMDVSWISKRIKSEDSTIHQKIKSILELLDEAVKTVRKIASELRPSILDDLGLIDALQWYSLEFEKRFGIPVSFQTSVEEISTAKNVSIGLFRIYQESLTNVARHAGASFVKSEIKVESSTILLAITDNGKGFNTETTGGKKTLGLLGMKERTLMMGGTYTIHSERGKGTAVVVSVPYRPVN